MDLPVVVGVIEVTAEGVLQRYSQIFLTFFDVSVYICSMNTSFMVSFFKKKKKKPQHFNTDFVKIKKLNQKHKQQKTAIYCPLEACSKRSWFQSNLQLMVNGMSQKRFNKFLVKNLRPLTFSFSLAFELTLTAHCNLVPEGPSWSRHCHSLYSKLLIWVWK